jgi:hypothetical protein
LNGDVRGGLNQAELTPASIQNKARLDTTGLTGTDIVIGAVKDDPSQENMTNLRLSDIASLIGVGAGAGLSIDGDGNVQLGNDGAGRIDISDTDVFESGFSLFYSDSEKSASFEFLDSETKSINNYDDGINLYQSDFEFQASASGASIRLNKSVGAFGQSLLFDSADDLIKITDTLNSKGLEYASDYESNFTARSLVTKQYVDGTVSGGLTLTSPITGYTVGANNALAATDTLLGAFGKIQGQINARVSGTIASGQVAFGTGVNTVGGDSALTWNNTTKILSVSNGVNITNSATGVLLNIDNPSTNNNSTVLNLFNKSNSSGVATANIAMVIHQYRPSSTGLQIDATNTGTMLSMTNSQNTNYGTQFGTSNFIRLFNNRLPTINPNWVSESYIIDQFTYITHKNYALYRLDWVDTVVSTNGFTINTTNTWQNTSLIQLWQNNGVTRASITAQGSFNGFNGIFNGSISVGGVTPTNTLDVNGTTRIRTISNLGSTATRFLVASATGVVSERTGAELRADLSVPSGSATTGQVAFWNSSTSISGENALFWDSANDRLGINQAVPTERLHVNGNGLFNGTVTTFTNNPLFTIRDSDLDVNAVYLGANFDFASGLVSYGTLAINRNPASGVFFNTGRAASQINLESRNGRADIGFYTSSANNTSPSLSMWIAGDGNVGIGTGFDLNAPTQRLVVLGNGLFGNLTSTGTATPINVSFGGTFGNSTAGSVANMKWFLYQDSTPSNSYGIGMSAGLMEVRAGAGASMAFFPNNGVELMRLISGGFVTIGVNAAPANTRMTVRGLGTTTQTTELWEASDGTDNVQFIDNGQIRFLRLPTSSAGLPTGSLWNNGGVINIV